MALLYTWAMILNKIQEDCDLINEPMISTDELLGYANEAIESAETAVHTIGIEDTYFKSWDFIYLNSGQSAYSFPADIYANKILKMFYANPSTTTVVSGTLTSGSATVTVASATGLAVGQAVFGTGIPNTTKVYAISGTTVTLSQNATASGAKSLSFVSIQPVNGARRYEVTKMRSDLNIQYSYPGDNYQFEIFNLAQSAGGNQINLYPTPAETGALIMVLYIREFLRLTSSLTLATNVCELPECINYIFQYMKWKIAIKRRMPEIAAMEKETVKQEYILLQETFKEMVPDGNNKVQLDLSAYFNQELDLYY